MLHLLTSSIASSRVRGGMTGASTKGGSFNPAPDAGVFEGPDSAGRKEVEISPGGESKAVFGDWVSSAEGCGSPVESMSSVGRTSRPPAPGAACCCFASVTWIVGWEKRRII